MAKRIEPVASNPNYVKTCILYEMLQEKPIFDSYRNFCKTIGDNVIDYTDFEYWYYRFYHGKMDFDHDPSTGPKQKTIVELPPEVLSMIFKKLDPVECAYLRNMNRLFKRTADIHSPIFEEISFQSTIPGYSFSLDGKYFEYIDNGFGSCTVHKNERPGKKVYTHYLSLCLRNFRQALALPNAQIKTFSVVLDDLLSAQIESFPEQMHVMSLKVRCGDRAPVMALLSKMVPGELKTLTLVAPSGQTGNKDPIYETEQFKKAEHVNLLQFTTMRNFNEFVHFEHLKSFKVSFPTMSAPSIVRLRDMLSSSTIFEECIIENSSEPIESFGRALGANIPAGRIGSFTHRHSIPSSDACLECNFDYRKIHIKKAHFISRKRLFN